ncbi:MAG: photosystem reaction center subunit H [Elusimicrobia bacterium RIFOXYB2_FULL_49_7]|nr:MAG: photosystem reaction center subunit H [Elusimicrobia bacterium RIFOXYB2_FULL_49_7]
MLINAKTLAGYKLDSLDGVIGQVKDFYFDDRYWTVRYLVADTGTWLTERQVLLSPYAVKAVITEMRLLVLNLTKKQIEQSPSLECDKPVSQQFEDIYYGYYGWPTYWGGTAMWGDSPLLIQDHQEWKKVNRQEKKWDPNLRSMHDASSHHIHALDGEIGHVEDFIIDQESWAIRYIIIDTTNWLPGKKVLVSPQWIERVSWMESAVFINLSREAIQGAPEYTEESRINRDYEINLHHHYDRPGYWPALSAHQKDSV